MNSKSDLDVITRIVEGKHERSMGNKFVDDQMWNLLLRCWALEPAERPHISEIVEELVDISAHQKASADEESSDSEETVGNWDTTQTTLPQGEEPDKPYGPTAGPPSLPSTYTIIQLAHELEKATGVPVLGPQEKGAAGRLWVKMKAWKEAFEKYTSLL